MDVGTRKQLFIDERFIASSEGVRLCMNPPVQYPEPVLVADRPWEAQGLGAYNTVLREPDGCLRMWYAATMKSGLPQEGAVRLCYAESDDGLNWNKPSLGLIPFAGSADNNIVAPPLERQSQQGATVYRDERAPAGERYKLWTKFQPTRDEEAAGSRGGLYAMHSADGLRWSIYPGQPSPPGQWSDTQNMLFWDQRLEQYVGYTRVKETQSREEAAAMGRGRYRSVGRITSPDFHDWSSTQIVLEADEADLTIPLPAPAPDKQPVLDFYTSCAMPYVDAEDVYLMFPAVFYHWGEEQFPATMDVQLLTSRDGISWRRAGDREPFLRRGLDGSRSGGMVFANPWLVPAGDELWLYYMGSGRTHATNKADPAMSGIFRAALRKDGFISVNSGYGGGSFTTPEICFSGNRLEPNLDGSGGGWLMVEIQDAQGLPAPGFSLAEADPLTGNALRKVVSWGGQSDVSQLAGQPCRLHFVMRDTRLYAFQFIEAD
jgi:hypothetical protein